MTLFRVVALLLAVVASAPAQNEFTRLFNAFSNQATDGAAVLSPALPNIGQSQHRATIYFTDAPGQTCVGHATDISFVANDELAELDATLFRIGVPLTSVAADSAGVISGQLTAHGAFRVTKIVAANFDTTNCRLWATYSGTLFPFSLVPAYPPARTSGFVRQTIDVAAIGDTVIVAASATPNVQVCVYELLFYNDAAQELTWLSDAVDIIPTMDFGGNAGFYAANTGNFHFCTLVGDGLVLNTSAGTQVSGYVLYRYE